MDLHVVRIPSRDPRLGRHIVHDPASKAFMLSPPVDTSAWRTINVRVYDPIPNPNQEVGNCTACAQCMQFNTIRNRTNGRTFKMSDADALYALETRIDVFPGQMPEDDTGSNAVAACKAAQRMWGAGTYHWYRNVDEVVQAIQAGKTVSLGTRWHQGMFDPDSRGVIEPTGPVVGGHQYLARGFNIDTDRVRIRCWWGDFRDVDIDRTQLGDLLADAGDSHTQEHPI